MTILEMQNGGMAIASPSASSDTTDQASHAAAPQAYQSQVNVKQIVIVVGGFMAVVYVLHLAERAIGKQRKG